MQFTEHTFEIEVPKGVDSTQVIQVTGFVGEGTGLGCYLAHKNDHTEAWTLLHIHSNTHFLDPWFGPFADSEQKAKRWLELVDYRMSWIGTRHYCGYSNQLKAHVVERCLEEAGGGWYWQ